MSGKSDVIQLSDGERRSLRSAFITGTLDLSNFPTIQKLIDDKRGLTPAQIDALIEKL